MIRNNMRMIKGDNRMNVQVKVDKKSMQHNKKDSRKLIRSRRLIGKMKIYFFQISGTDVQDDSMMILLKPNVTNWIMLHQRDFNFQVLVDFKENTFIRAKKRRAHHQKLPLQNHQVFNSLTIPTKDFYLNFYENEERYLQRANLYVVSMLHFPS